LAGGRNNELRDQAPKELRGGDRSVSEVAEGRWRYIPIRFRENEKKQRAVDSPRIFGKLQARENNSSPLGTDLHRTGHLMADEAAELMARWQQGDQNAATELFRRYANRLVALARTRLSSHVSQRFDPEDVVQSAYRSFFSGAVEGRYDIERGGDLWKLLVSITLHKVQKKVRAHLTQKRNAGQDRSLDAARPGEVAFREMIFAKEPSPIEAVALIDQVEDIMRHLPPPQRRILELRLQGYDFKEIDEATNAGLKSVRRALYELRQTVEALYRQAINPPD
jgi:RNA polymerase sigma-70 factor (ECF subfamily)